MSLFWLESQQPIVTSLNLKVISRCPMDQRITEVRLLSLPLLLVCTTFSAALGNHTGRIKVVFTPTICKLTCIGGRCHNNCELGNTTTIISENGHATDTLTAPNFRVGKWSWRFVYFFFSYFFSGRISTEHTHTQAHLLTSKPYLTPVKQMNTLQNCLLWSLVSGIVHGHKIIVLQTCCWKKKNVSILHVFLYPLWCVNTSQPTLVHVLTSFIVQQIAVAQSDFLLKVLPLCQMIT